MAKTENTNPQELRFNYLGFEYLPGKLKDFWTSEDEKQKYLKKIRDPKAQKITLERDFSIVNANQFNKADRIIISIASAFMILSLFLPYYNFMAYGKQVSGISLGYLFNIGYVGNFAAWGSFVMKLILAMSAIMIIISPAVGVMNLIALNKGQTKPDYYNCVKNAGRMNIIALLLYVLFFLLLTTGQMNPFGSLGIDALGDTLGLGSLISMSGYAIWVNIGAHILGMIPALEL
jgi:hypothetical protein